MCAARMCEIYMYIHCTVCVDVQSVLCNICALQSVLCNICALYVVCAWYNIYGMCVIWYA